ncbi:Os08g0398450, partial [Oryza sativa Japonica Group]
GSYLLHGVEVLRNQNHIHDILGRGPRHVLGEGKNTVSQPIHYSLTLPCDTQTSQVLGFCISFSSLDLKNLLCFSFLIGCHPQPSSCIIK